MIAVNRTADVKRLTKRSVGDAICIRHLHLLKDTFTFTI